MKKTLFLLCCFTILSLSAFTIEVDKPEIESVKNKQIEFINYEGKHESVDSVEAISGIGKSLGSAAKTGRAGISGKYSIIHCVDPKTKEGLDADIFIIGKNAGVDHINNVRLIIAGYLQSAYGYSKKDAKTIAHFVTIYNAVYRGNMSAFKKKYKDVVLQNLSAGKAGIALSYTEWAGNTQILIPLSDSRLSGTISTVDTTSISDKEVVDKMREDKDKDIEKRKEMVDLKERESKEAEKRAKVTKKESKEKKKEATKKKKESKKKEKVAEKKKKEAKKAKKTAEKTGDEKDKKVAEEKQKEADKAEKEAEEAKKEAEKAEEDAKAKEDEAKEDEELAEKKEDEAQSDRKDIAADTQKIIEDKKAEKKAEADAIMASAIPGFSLKVVDEAGLLSQLVLLDLKTENELKSSGITSIRGRSLFVVGKNLLAIAGTSSGDGVIALVLINSRTLEITKQSSEDIAAESVLVKRGEDYYAVINQDGSYYIGRYNDKLELQAKSGIKVIPYTPITISDKGLLIQDANNAIRLLKFSDLTNIVVSEEPEEESAESDGKENVEESDASDKAVEEKADSNSTGLIQEITEESSN